MYMKLELERNLCSNQGKVNNTNKTLAKIEEANLKDISFLVDEFDTNSVFQNF